jgi:hypothetical protein
MAINNSIIDVTGQGERISYSTENLDDSNSFVGKLGDEYKTSLRLNEQQIYILNQLWYPNNNFSSIPFCRAEIVKLFVLILSDLSYKYLKLGTTIEVQFNTIADLLTRNHIKTGLNDYNYKFTLLSFLNEIHFNIFKHAENALRAHYGHTRKITTEIDCNDEEIRFVYQTLITDKLLQILPIWVPRVDMPDTETEILLNTQNTGRWKLEFEGIKQRFKSNPKEFLNEVLRLADLNKNNPSLEMIYYEAAKEISSIDQVTALKLYTYYVHVDLQSDTFDHRPLNKTSVKKLFKTEEQYADFQTIISKLIADRDLKQALVSVADVLSPKRKKIQLDHSAIVSINQRHAGTVELLNKYLQDDEEEEKVNSPDLPLSTVTASLQPQATGVTQTIFTEEIRFSSIQTAIVIHFAKSNFTVPQSELEQMAKEQGAFRNQLIDSINECCYEHLDDVLIEEEEDNYIIYEQYYQNILAK